MKAAVFQETGVLSVEEVPTPRPKPSEVLARVDYCGICGSDLHRYQHRLMAHGVIMGHEWSGTIVELGEGVEDWSVGDRVVRTRSKSAIPDPRYSARAKGFTLDVRTPGGFAEFAALPADAFLPVPESMSAAVAALAEPLSNAVHALRLSDVRMGDSVVVMGAGPIGLFVMQCALQCGLRQVVVCEPLAVRREIASQLGADVVLNPSQVDVEPEVLRLTGGLGADVVFECAGGQQTLQQTFMIVRRRGQVVLEALCMDPCSVTPLDWVGREVRLQCSYGYEREEMKIALDLLNSGRVAGQPLISRVVPLTEIQMAFDSLLRTTGDVKVLIQP